MYYFKIIFQTTPPLPRDAGARVPAVSGAEDGARAARPPRGVRPPEPGRALLPRARRLSRRTGKKYLSFGTGIFGEYVFLININRSIFHLCM